MLKHRDKPGMERTPLQVDHQASNDVHEEDDQERECAKRNPEKEGPQSIHEHQAKERHRHNGYNDGATIDTVTTQNFQVWLLFMHADRVPPLHRETWCVGNRARERCSGTGSRPGNTEHLTAHLELPFTPAAGPSPIAPLAAMCAILGTATPAVWGLHNLARQAGYAASDAASCLFNCCFNFATRLYAADFSVYTLPS